MQPGKNRLADASQVDAGAQCFCHGALPKMHWKKSHITLTFLSPIKGAKGNEIYKNGVCLCVVVQCLHLESWDIRQYI
jgi:hypothetical protein